MLGPFTFTLESEEFEKGAKVFERPGQTMDYGLWLKHRWERLTKTHKSVSFYIRQREGSKQWLNGVNDIVHLGDPSYF